MTFFGYPHREESVFDFLERSALEPEQLGVSWPDLEEPERFDPINFRPVLHVCQLSWTGRDDQGDRGFDVWCSCGAALTASPRRVGEFVEKHERVPFDFGRLEEARQRMRDEVARYLAVVDVVFAEKGAA